MRSGLVGTVWITFSCEDRTAKFGMGIGELVSHFCALNNPQIGKPRNENPSPGWNEAAHPFLHAGMREFQLARLKRWRCNQLGPKSNKLSEANMSLAGRRAESTPSGDPGRFRGGPDDGEKTMPACSTISPVACRMLTSEDHTALGHVRGTASNWFTFSI